MKSYILLIVLVSAAVFVDHCSGLCAITDCTMGATGQASQAETCKIVKTYVDCLTTKLINDDSCPQAIKDAAIQAKKQIENQLEKCGVAGLVSSFVLCLAMSGVTYLLTSFK